MPNVISSGTNTDKHYLHSGFSATIDDSYASPDIGPAGMTWDSTNVISQDTSSDRHYLHSGFSSTISDSYPSPTSDPTGITWDGFNVISSSLVAPGKHFLNSGFTTTISDSYTSPNTVPFGITWDRTNVISADFTADKHYLHSGFSSTITDSYPDPDGTPTGITWDGRDFSALAPIVSTFAVSTVTGATTVSATIPSGDEGDLLIACHTSDGGSETLTPPAGWSNVTGNISDGTTTSRIFSKEHSGSETTPQTFTCGSSEAQVVGVVLVKNQLRTDPVEVASSGTGSSNAPTSPDVTTLDTNTLVMRFVGNDDGRDNNTDGGYPTGHTGEYYRNSSAAATGCAQGFAHKAQSAAAATGTAAFSLTATEGWVGFTVIVNVKREILVIS